MLKSLFFRQKAGTDELLPPPPPFPSMELEEPKQESVSEDLSGDFLSDIRKEINLKGEINKSKSPKKLSKKELKRLSKIKSKEAKDKPAPKEEPPDLDNEFDFGQEPEFQDLDKFSVDNLKAEEEIKPKEIEEAEDEIMNAIEGVKKHGKKSLFSGFFKKTAAVQAPTAEIGVGDVAAIKKKIDNARNSLINLDLEAAKNCYIDIMRAYNALKPEEQARVYHEVKDLYYERKNAEELKV